MTKTLANHMKLLCVGLIGYIQDSLKKEVTSQSHKLLAYSGIIVLGSINIAITTEISTV